MPLQQIQCAINSDPVYAGIKFARMAKDLSGVEVLFRIFDDFENRPSLMRHAQAP